MAKNENLFIQQILDLDVLELIFEMLKPNDFKLTFPALKVISCLLSADDAQTQYVLNRGVVQVLVPFLNHRKRLVRKETCLAFANVLAGNYTQIEEVIEYQDGIIVKRLFEMITNDEIDVNL